MKNFPFLTVPQTLALLIIFILILFIAHAAVRISSSTIESFAGFLSNEGIASSIAKVWAVTIFEIIGGFALMFVYFTKWLSLELIILRCDFRPQDW